MDADNDPQTGRQARSTLRYTAPKVTEQYLKGVLNVEKGKSVGDFTHTTSRPILDVDKKLGIKTRGGGTIKDLYRVERKLINVKGKNLVFEKKGRLSLTLNKQGKIIRVKDLEFSKGFIDVKASDFKKGFDVTKTTDGTVYTPTKYKDLFGVSLERNIFPKDNIIKIGASKTHLLNKIIDLSNKGFVKPTGLKKTPFSKTFGSTTFKETNIVNIHSKPSVVQDINKVINKLEKTSFTPSLAQSKFYGTGQYERSSGGLLPQSQGLDLLKLPPPLPKVNVNTGIKDLIFIKQANNLGLNLGLGLGTASTLKPKTALKPKTMLKSDLKLNNLLKDILKTKVDVGLKTNLKFKQSPALTTKQILTPQLTSPSLSVGLGSFMVTPPKIPTFKIPKTPVPAVIFFPNKRSKKKKKGKLKQINEYAYLPDFTSRAIGLNPEIISGKQAQARIKKILTGLEIRRGVRIK